MRNTTLNKIKGTRIHPSRDRGLTAEATGYYQAEAKEGSGSTDVEGEEEEVAAEEGWMSATSAEEGEQGGPGRRVCISSSVVGIF